MTAVCRRIIFLITPVYEYWFYFYPGFDLRDDCVRANVIGRISVRVVLFRSVVYVDDSSVNYWVVKVFIVLYYTVPSIARCKKCKNS